MENLGQWRELPVSQGNQVLTLIRFTQAATELFLTQSAVSKQMHALEESLEMPLFERKPNGVALTTAGEELLSTVDVVLERLHHSVRLPAATRMEHLQLFAWKRIVLCPAQNGDCYGQDAVDN
ncbi:regulatory helix-turn-helix protein, lysR family [Pseudomonas frederiksbergensis]|uniref:Regulatory helix-turn-helix protein, lysR family n=1 Tax=Pseudomonas frederiksbergensis TaxID=104087 RepID=A0A1H5EDQ9_9PSED|nr:regulatory helix-turn-helix protein, lysR family [Pseudomonas frederiksbergensis]